ncbi:16S rRNA (uracil(1498)-N(3))-methyltransferase [Desulfitibacter alkalitolerans]|uniref:16S rRNA (uracil(1498)-N(3))-methyltransferase n=1 Tax=Desulfitibacter alkalitolerans TaxID=264641 RepID=UPI0006852DDD|nr:16S rRNA (uracil(1498)-N(3))-methyltransferase [Desulfitibacter alkalitolerans]
MYQFRIPKGIKITNGDLCGSKLEILGEEAHHIANVLRLKEGSLVGLFDGFGYKAAGILLDVTNERVLVELTHDKVANTEPPVEITLYQSLPKKDKLELIIQKATELGVKNIVPIITKRTIVHIDNEKAKKKVERWNKIAQEACKQSGRAYVPQISEPISFKAMLSEIKAEINIIPYEAEDKKGLKQVLRSFKESMPKSIGIFIGPEGGWDKDEVQMAVNHGIIPVTLGPRILRTETASLAVLTMILYELGDLGG